MSGEETPSKQRENPGSQSGKPITRYLMILFAAALALLLISFFMQQRNHQVLLELNDSMTEQQESLQASKEQLQLQVTDLQEKLDAAQTERDKAQKAQETAQQQAEALEWLRQIQRAMSRSYQEAAELRSSFEESGLPGALPERSAVEGKSSPKEDYAAICQRLPS